MNDDLGFVPDALDDLGFIADAVAEPRAAQSDPNFEVSTRTPSAPGVFSGYVPQDTSSLGGLDISPTRALLTNDPTSGYTESFMRGLPAQAGAVLGGAAGGGMSAGLASVPGAMAGAAAGEGVRQNLSQVYAGLSGRQLSTPGQVFGNMTAQGVLGGIGQAGAVGLKNLGGFVVKQSQERLPTTLKRFFDIPEPITDYVTDRGSANVFTPANLEKGAPTANVGQAIEDLSNARSSVGANIGMAENQVLNKIGGNAPSVRHIREGLQDALYGRGITDPRTAGLARGKEVGILNKLVEVLTPAEGGASNLAADGISRVPVADKLTLRQAINAKRLIDDNLEFAGKELSSSTEQILKRANHQLRESVRSDMGQEVSNLWDQFGAIADAQEKLSEFTGRRLLSNTEQRGVDGLKRIMMKNPDKVNEIVKVLGAGLPGGETQARAIFDSIAGAGFAGTGFAERSSMALKALSMVTPTGAVARGLVRGSEAVGNANLNPAALSYGGLTALSPLAQNYINPRLRPAIP